MRSFKKLLVLLLALTLVFAFVGCGGNDQADDQTDDQQQEEQADQAADETADDQAEEPAEESADESAEEPAEEPAATGNIADAVFVEVNGTKIVPGENYADIEGKIGDETKPSERVEPCDPEFEDADMNYFFDGYELTTVADTGFVRIIMVDERCGDGRDALLCGKLALGCTADDIHAVLGEPAPEDEDEMFITYTYDNGNIIVYKDEEGKNTITGYVISINEKQ